jgi:serine protease SohB
MSNEIINAFCAYGLFLAKLLSLLLFAGLSIVAVASAISARPKTRETLSIEKLNEHYEEMQELLESEVLSKKSLKALKKSQKKKQKASKHHKTQPASKRVFVIDFCGDMRASEVATLRETITALLLILQADDEVVIRLESYGGVVHDYGLASAQLQRLKDIKGVSLTVVVDLAAASGGYLMAVVADKILAAPFAIIGSIGVMAQLPNFHKLLNKYDIDIEQHSAGEYKTTLTMLGKNTEKGRSKFQEELNITHTLFKQLVQQYRPQLPLAQVATGEYWYGSQALEYGLIDGITTSDSYLLQHWQQDAELFMVSYEIQESFSEKLQNLLHKTYRTVLKLTKYA